MHREYQVVVMGAGGVGKSSLVTQFVSGIWVDTYDPTIEDSYRKQVQVDNRQCILEILDTAGTEQFSSLRHLYMTSGQGFLLIFSLTSPSSFNELNILREEIVRIKGTQDVPFVIVGNKADLEEDRAIPTNTGQSLASTWKRASYYETSAKHNFNVDEVFKDLTKQIMDKDTLDTVRREAESKAEKDGLEENTKQNSRRMRRTKKKARCVIL